MLNFLNKKESVELEKIKDILASLLLDDLPLIRKLLKISINLKNKDRKNALAYCEKLIRYIRENEPNKYKQILNSAPDRAIALWEMELKCLDS